MKRTMLIFLVFLLILAIPASAASTLNKYSLIVNGERIPLSSSTGYIGKSSGGRITVPVGTLLDALGIDYSAANSGKRLYIEGKNKSRVELSKGYNYARVNGKKKSIRTKAYMQNSQLMADLSVLKLLGATYKTASKSKLSKKGYPGGAVSVSTSGKSATFPTLSSTVQPTPAPTATPAPTESNSFAAELPAASTCDQMVVVKYDRGSNAKLTMHEKGEDGIWRQVLSTSAYVGKNGIGKTKEGDKKTPTGTYNLTTPFGIKKNPGTSLNYVKVTRSHYWCGTSGSKYYNQLIDTRVTNRKRTSSDEYLISYSGVYNYCAFIDYNANGTAGKGSCIFLHCTGSKKYTAGCIAIPESVMIKVLKRLKAGAKIVIY